MNCAVPVNRLRRDRLVFTATRLFGSKEEAEVWLKTPNANLNGQRPFDLADTDAGFEDALAELEALGSLCKNPRLG